MAASMHDSTESSPATAATLLANATRLAPEFKSRAAAAERNRQLDLANVEAMREAGLLKVYVPRRFGGDELHMVDVLPSVAQLARGCAASAWVLAVYQIHNWVVALMDDSVQSEVFGETASPIIAASLNPMKNVARLSDGGFTIDEAQFTFCSGANAREWILAGVQVFDDADEVADVGCLLIPGSELEEVDDWYVSGLQGTGSFSLAVQDLFVPKARFLSYGTACANQSPGVDVNPHSLFNAAFVPMLVLNLGGPALGIAEQALSDFMAILKSKPGAYPITGEMRSTAPQAHTMIAEAEMRIDIARLLFERAGRAMRDAANEPGRMTRSLAAKTCVDTTWATRECLGAVQDLFLHSGGGVLAPTHPLQRAYQDVSAINCHGFLSHESAVRLYGALSAGQEEPTAFI